MFSFLLSVNNKEKKQFLERTAIELSMNNKLGKIKIGHIIKFIIRTFHCKVTTVSFGIEPFFCKSNSIMFKTK